MTDPINDKKLIDFLNRNYPNPPEAPPDSEERIMLAIEREDRLLVGRKNGKNHRLTFPRLSSLSVWFLPPAIAASFLIFGSGYQLLHPSKLSPTEEANLEAFVVNNWEGAVGDSPAEAQPERELDWYPLSIPSDP